MSIDVHAVSQMPNSTFVRTDRVFMGLQASVTNAAGSGAGASVTVAVTGFADLPASYGVFVNPGQDATWFVSGKSNTGFTITLNPRLAANTLAAGALDLLIVA